MALFASSIVLADRSLVLRLALFSQVALYLLGGYGAWLEHWHQQTGARTSLVQRTGTVAFTFVVMNCPPSPVSARRCSAGRSGDDQARGSGSRSTSAAAACRRGRSSRRRSRARTRPTFATAPYNEPRDWGYAGLLAFTAVLMPRPQDTLPFLDPFHLAEVCAIIGIAPMVLHRFAQRPAGVPRHARDDRPDRLRPRHPVAPCRSRSGRAARFGLFTDSYLKLLVVFVLMMNTLTTPKRIEQITWLIVLCCGFIAARSVFDYARGVNLVEGNRLAGPVGGIFGNPNDLAMNMVTFLPAAAVIALSRRFSLPSGAGGARVGADAGDDGVHQVARRLPRPRRGAADAGLPRQQVRPGFGDDGRRRRAVRRARSCRRRSGNGWPASSTTRRTKRNSPARAKRAGR